MSGFQEEEEKPTLYFEFSGTSAQVQEQVRKKSIFSVPRRYSYIELRRN